MFGTQIDDPVTATTPLKADPVVTGAKIHGFQIDPIQPPVDPCLCCLRPLVDKSTCTCTCSTNPPKLFI